MRFRFTCYAIIALSLIALPVQLFAYDPRLDWKTISTEHFDVHYHDGAEWTAQQVAQVAEEIYPSITKLYDYEPKRCNFVILDTDDYANGAAYFYDNKIEIWATNLEFGLRGTTNWLRNVVTHEYAHIVSIQAAMKMPRRVPAIYVQGVSFETEKRPDVITGYPNFIGSYPIVGAIIPPWWAEGVAQYQAPGIQSDCWDTHREMILRTAVVEDKMLSHVEMGYLGHKSIGNEMVYDHGYGLVRYIADTYGSEAIGEISAGLRKWNRLTIDGALEKVTGKGLEGLYEDWKVWLADRYARQLAQLPERSEGWVFDNDGFMTHSPSYSPDGSKVAFLSNKGYDFSLTSLYVADADGKNAKRIRPAVTSRTVFSPDGTKILYASHKRVDKYGAMVSDVFVYDLEREKFEQITKGRRLSEPNYSPDASEIICVKNGDGTHQLVVMDADGGNMRVIFERGGGAQFYTPQYSPDGKRILFGVFTGGTRDIATIAADGSDFRYLVRTPNDERDACWTDGGKEILFASDRNGVFNIYRMNVSTGDVEQATSVVGGAFTPALSPADGSIAYASYTADGYNVSVLEPAAGEPVETLLPAEYAKRAVGEFDECVSVKARDDEHKVVGGTKVASQAAYGAASVVSAADGLSGAVPRTAESLTGVGTNAGGATDAASSGADDAIRSAPGQTTLESEDYKSVYTDFQIFPRVVIWDGVPRLGAFIVSNELLDKQQFFAGGSYGLDGGFDAFVDFSFRRWYPVFFMQFFRMRQMYDDRVALEDVDDGQGGVEDRLYFLDIRYDLWAADLGLRFEFADIYSLVHRHDFSFWFDYSEYSVHIDPEYTTEDDPNRNPDFAGGWDYFRGREYYAQYFYKAIIPSIDSNINPRGGRELMLRLMYADDDLFTSGEFVYGFKPDFGKYRFGQYTLDYSEYLALPWWRHSLQVRLFGSYIDNNVDDFFWVYMGGMDRLRGYTFFTIGGRAGAMASARYRFPIWRRINKQASWLTFKDVYGGVFFELGNAWDDEGFETEGYKRAAGYELRFNMGSFYMYPTTINFIGAYALDRAVYRNPLFDIFTVHDPQWRYYGTVGFNF